MGCHNPTLVGLILLSAILGMLTRYKDSTTQQMLELRVASNDSSQDLLWHGQESIPPSPEALRIRQENLDIREIEQDVMQTKLTKRRKDFEDELDDCVSSALARMDREMEYRSARSQKLDNTIDDRNINVQKQQSNLVRPIKDAVEAEVRLLKARSEELEEALRVARADHKAEHDGRKSDAEARKPYLEEFKGLVTNSVVEASPAFQAMKQALRDMKTTVETLTHNSQKAIKVIEDFDSTGIAARVDKIYEIGRYRVRDNASRLDYMDGLFKLILDSMQTHLKLSQDDHAKCRALLGKIEYAMVSHDLLELDGSLNPKHDLSPAPSDAMRVLTSEDYDCIGHGDRLVRELLDKLGKALSPEEKKIN